MKKLDEVTKIKLIYSGELVLFAIAFIVIGILQLVDVINPGETFLNIFKYVTLVGAGYFIFDFVTSFMNPAKRERVCFVDKASTVFVPPYVITLDILLFANNELVTNSPKYFLAPLFFMIALAYIFQSIYHWFYPLQELLDESNEEEKEKENKDEVKDNADIQSNEVIEEEKSEDIEK